MRHENAQDPRRVLINESYFGMRPEPLERYLYSIKISQVAERVFWLHWDVGQRNGDFTSELSLRYVARHLNRDESTITRAYQALKRLGLIRRIDRGRDASNPFQRATAITEVLLPRAALGVLQSAPKRGKSVEVGTREARPVDPPSAPAVPIDGAPELVAPEVWERAREQLEGTLETREFKTWVAPLSAAAQGKQLVLLAPNGPAKQYVEERLAGRILEALAAGGYTGPVVVRVEAAPAAPPSAAAVAGPPPQEPRKVGAGDLALLRSRIAAISATHAIDERLREAVWSIEQGALRAIPSGKAMAIAVKLMREHRWQRPHRMPPNWLLRVAA